MEIHVKKYKCEKCKRVSNESKYIYIKNYKVTSNRTVNKETNKPNKEKIYKGNKYIGMYVCVCVCIYIYIHIHTYKHDYIYIQIHIIYTITYTNMKINKYIETHVEKYLCENIRVY